MAKKKLSAFEQFVSLAKSKRGAIVALIGALAIVEATQPGTLAAVIGEAWATKVMAVVGLLVAVTKVIDNNKAA